MLEGYVMCIHRKFDCRITKASMVHKIKLYLYVTPDTMFIFSVI